MSDSALLSQILALLETWFGLVENPYTSLATSGGAVTDSVPLIRAAMPTAVKTVIINQGPSAVIVYENAGGGNVPVAIVPQQSSKEVPLAGAGIIQVNAISGAADTAQVNITTYLNVNV